MISLIYSPHFAMGFPGLRFLHPFDSYRARRAYQRLAHKLGLPGHPVDTERDGVRLCVPEGPVDDATLTLVHTSEYLQTLRSSLVVARAIEVWPFALTPRRFLDWCLVTPMRWAVTGTLLAARRALEDGMAFSLTGGFHHAKPNQGEGFCLFNDIGLAIKTLQAEGAVDRVLYIDLDAHQGNGVCAVFAEDRRVRLFDVYNGDIYPYEEDEARARLDASFPLDFGTGDPDYLDLLHAELPAFFEAHGQADLVVYNAGTDIVQGDPLGGLKVSPQSILERDLLVLSLARQRRLPVVFLPSGGYTRDSYKLIAETVLRARDLS